MRYIAASILIISLSVMLLCGCGQENINNTPPKKQELTFACGRDKTDTLETILREFSEQSETTQVKLVELPKSSIDTHRILNSALTGQEVEIDAMLAEDIWVKEFIKNGYLKDLSEMAEFSAQEYLAGVAKLTQSYGSLYWYPMILDVGVMYYNSELTDKPSTYDKLVGSENASYTIQGADGEEMLCVALELIQAAGSVRSGLEMYKTAIKESGVSEDDDYMSAFKNGKAAYMRGWASESNDVLHGFSPVRGKVRAAAMETPPGQTCTLARVYGFAANAASRKDEAIRELLQYLLRDEVQKQIVTGMGTLPLRYVYYEDPMIMDSTAYYDDYKRLSAGLTYRQQRDDYTFASREVRNVIENYIEGKAELDEAETAMETFLTAQKQKGEQTSWQN